MGDFENNNSDREGGSASCSGRSIDSSNIGFQLLKKHGWKEGTGLGASQQGRLEPVETYFKKNKRGLGAEKTKVKKYKQSAQKPPSTEKGESASTKEPMSKKEKALSKRMRKMLEEEKRWREKEFERAFFREFWPDNV